MAAPRSPLASINNRSALSAAPGNGPRPSIARSSTVRMKPEKYFGVSDLTTGVTSRPKLLLLISAMTLLSSPVTNSTGTKGTATENHWLENLGWNGKNWETTSAAPG